MDNSEQYIKMRLTAIPYLGLGTSILSGMFVVTEDVFVDNKGDFYIHCDRAPYWCQLERQDQLQEMYLKDMPAGTYIKIFTLLEEFYGHFETQGYPSYAFSMEQLWLAFVMWEKFGKVWDGETWA